MSTGAQVDYDALAKQYGATSSVDYDALAKQHGATSSTAPEKSVNEQLTEVRPWPKYDPNHPIASAVRAVGTGIGNVGAGAIAGTEGMAGFAKDVMDPTMSLADFYKKNIASIPSSIKSMVSTVKSGHPEYVAGAMIPGIAASELGDAIKGGMKDAGSSLANRAIQSTLGQTATQTLPEDVANAPVGITRGAATTGGAPTSITNAEVLQHAGQEGIPLTPAQAGIPTARSIQVLGEEAPITGGKIPAAIAKSKGLLSDAMDNFQDKIDPKRIGLSAESAGEHLQNSADIAKSVLKDNVNYAYDQVKAAQTDLGADVQGPLHQLFNQEINPGGNSVYKTTGARTAMADIEQMLTDPALQGKASVESLRNLRTNLLEKGNDYGANALSDSGQRIYKLAAGKVDDAIMQGAKGTPFEEVFRDAGSQNAKLQQLYNTKGSPLYRILNTDDPAQVTNGILNRSSVHEIETLKNENLDLGPLARQAVQDIRDGGFRVTPNGLGGYPDTFLRSLLGPDATRELYLKSEIARRLAENYNSSGSGRTAVGVAQLLHPVAAVAGQAARKYSMPQTATNFLPKVP